MMKENLKKKKKKKAAVRRSSNNTAAREEEEEEEEEEELQIHDQSKACNAMIIRFMYPKRKPKKIHTAVDCDRLQRKSSNFFLLHRLRNAKDSGSRSLPRSLALSLLRPSAANEDEERKKTKGTRAAALNSCARNFQLPAPLLPGMHQNKIILRMPQASGVTLIPHF
jgi:hypothetical protein